MRSRVKRNLNLNLHSLFYFLKNESYYLTMLILFISGVVLGAYLKYYGFYDKIYLISEQYFTVDKTPVYALFCIFTSVLSCILIYCTGLSYSGKILLYCFIPLIGSIAGADAVRMTEGQSFFAGLSSIAPVAALEAAAVCCYFILTNYALIMSGAIKEMIRENGREVPDIKEYRIRTFILLFVISIISFVALLIR